LTALTLAPISVFLLAAGISAMGMAAITLICALFLRQRFLSSPGLRGKMLLLSLLLSLLLIALCRWLLRISRKLCWAVRSRFRAWGIKKILRNSRPRRALLPGWRTRNEIYITN
jgi:hypothetical protein